MNTPRLARSVVKSGVLSAKNETLTRLARLQRDATQSSPSAPLQMSIADLIHAPGVHGWVKDRPLEVHGFVRSIRNHKKMSFASIGDGSTLEPMQAVLTPSQAQSLSNGTAVRLVGQWREPPATKKDKVNELYVQSADVIGATDPSKFPIQKKYHTSEFLRTIPHLRNQIPFNSTLLRLRSDTIAAITKYFAAEAFTQTHTPIITSSDCEGAGEVFNVHSSLKDRKDKTSGASFFGSPKYLTVSSQLHLEALAHSMGKVWTLSPTFRAEKSDTARHLSEFYMLEAEVNFVDDMEHIMDAVENLVRSITTSLFDSQVGKEILASRDPAEEHQNSDRAAMIKNRWKGLTADIPWPRITYSQAIKELQSSSHTFQHKAEWGLGLQAEHERYIAETVCKSPVFITHYPRSIKPFYMLPSAIDSEKQGTVECFDLIFPEACEIAGGSMREYRLLPLIESMQRHGMAPPGSPMSLEDEDLGGLSWYVDLRRWGSVPHGGFGIGFDRLLGYLAGVRNIREITTFPRWVGRCEC
ncbi:asparaginyl-tRNA synthetase-like protein [Halenospora varia]|nr:asparaginyl-tRNA synthetase-like protein [Halenospora varia]